MIGHLYLCDIQPFADVGSAGSVHYHGLKTSGNIRLQLVNGYKSGAVFVSSGKMADQILQRKNIQCGKLLSFCRPHTLEYGYRVRQAGHDSTPFFFLL